MPPIAPSSARPKRSLSERLLLQHRDPVSFARCLKHARLSAPDWRVRVTLPLLIGLLYLAGVTLIPPDAPFWLAEAARAWAGIGALLTLLTVAFAGLAILVLGDLRFVLLSAFSPPVLALIFVTPGISYLSASAAPMLGVVLPWLLGIWLHDCGQVLVWRHAATRATEHRVRYRSARPPALPGEQKRLRAVLLVSGTGVLAAALWQAPGDPLSGLMLSSLVAGIWRIDSTLTAMIRPRKLFDRRCGLANRLLFAPQFLVRRALNAPATSQTLPRIFDRLARRSAFWPVACRALRAHPDRVVHLLALSTAGHAVPILEEMARITRGDDAALARRLSGLAREAHRPDDAQHWIGHCLHAPPALAATLNPVVTALRAHRVEAALFERADQPLGRWHGACNRRAWPRALRRHLASHRRCLAGNRT